MNGVYFYESSLTRISMKALLFGNTSADYQRDSHYVRSNSDISDFNETSEVLKKQILISNSYTAFSHQDRTLSLLPVQEIVVDSDDTMVWEVR